jgi:hypothetical protein
LGYKVDNGFFKIYLCVITKHNVISN